jgi:DNA-binding LacI/PurR family transcriptional regulator
VCHRDAAPSATSAAEIQFLMERQVDGLIIVPNPVHEDPAIFKTLADAGIPALFVDEMVPGAPGHFLGSQGRDGARNICQYLLNLGHRHICHVTAQNNSYSAKCRMDGYLDAMRGAGIEVNPEMIVHVDGWDYEDANAAVSKVLAMSPRPTAIFAANDPLAIQLSIGLRKAGVSVPGDISLAGFAGMQEGTFITPALTTVKQPSHELGKKAIETIISLIRGDKDVPIHTELPTRLLLRESCARPLATNRS